MCRENVYKMLHDYYTAGDGRIGFAFIRNLSDYEWISKKRKRQDIVMVMVLDC